MKPTALLWLADFVSTPTCKITKQTNISLVPRWHPSHDFPSPPLSDKVIRHRACSLKDTAHAIFASELDPEFGRMCDEIKEARRKRGEKTRGGTERLCAANRWSKSCKYKMYTCMTTLRFHAVYSFHLLPQAFLFTQAHFRLISYFDSLLMHGSTQHHLMEGSTNYRASICLETRHHVLCGLALNSFFSLLTRKILRDWFFFFFFKSTRQTELIITFGINKNWIFFPCKVSTLISPV